MREPMAAPKTTKYREVEITGEMTLCSSVRRDQRLGGRLKAPAGYTILGLGSLGVGAEAQAQIDQVLAAGGLGLVEDRVHVPARGRQADAEALRDQIIVTTEQDQLHTQIAQLDSEIDMIERNETLITMIEDREQAINEYSTGSRGVSIAQVEKRLAKIHAEQEARFNAITGRSKNSSFLDQAEQELMHEDAVDELEQEYSFEVPAPEAPKSMTIITPKGEHQTTNAYAMN